MAGLVICGGPCLRAFHPSCIGLPGPPADTAAWFCPECDSGRMRCFACGEFGAGFEDPTIHKCSLGVCGRFYHVRYTYSKNVSGGKAGLLLTDTNTWCRNLFLSAMFLRAA